MPAWLPAVAAMSSVQLSSALAVPLIEEVGPASTAWLRLSMGALVFLVVARPPLRSVRRQDVPLLLALGIATATMTLAFLSSIERIDLGTAVAIQFLGPLVLAALRSHDRQALAWPALALTGVVLLTEPWQASVDLVGVAFALGAGACWGLYNVLTQHVGDRFSGITGLSLTIPVAALATLPVGLPQVVGGDLAWWVLPAAAGIALITPVIAFGLEMLALRRMTHTAFGTLLSVEPAFGVLIGLLVLGQTPTALQVLGIAIVVGAGAAAQRGGGREAAPATTDLPASAAEESP